MGGGGGLGRGGTLFYLYYFGTIEREREKSLLRQGLSNHHFGKVVIRLFGTLWNNGHMPNVRYSPPHDLTVASAVRALLRSPRTKSATYTSSYLIANLQRLKRFRNHPLTTRATCAEMLYPIVAKHVASPERAKALSITILRWIYPSHAKAESDRFYPTSYKELNMGRVQALLANGGTLIPVQSNLEAMAHRRAPQLFANNSEDNAWLDNMTLHDARVL